MIKLRIERDYLQLPEKRNFNVSNEGSLSGTYRVLRTDAVTSQRRAFARNIEIPLLFSGTVVSLSIRNCPGISIFIIMCRFLQEMNSSHFQPLLNCDIPYFFIIKLLGMLMCFIKD